MIKITKENILKSIGMNTTLYHYAVYHIEHKNLLTISYDEAINTIVSKCKVEDLIYDSTIVLDDNLPNKISKINCSCSKNGQTCMHVLIGLVGYFFKSEELVQTQNENYNYIYDALDKYSILNNLDNTNNNSIINLVPTLNIDTKKEEFSVSFKIGFDKLYIVKDIKELIKAYINKNKLYYGANFTLDSNTQKFSETFNTLLDIFKNLYFYNSNVLENKFFKLADNHLDTLVEYMKTTDFSIVLNNKNIYDAAFTNDELGFDFSYKDSTLTYLNFNEYIFLSDKYVYYNRRIYTLNNETYKYLSPIINIFKNIKREEIRFDSKIINNAFGFLSIIKKYGNLVTENNENINEENLEASIYFEEDKRIIKGKVEFKYNNTIYNPFNSNSQMVKNRDIIKEGNIKHILELSNFKVKNEFIYLDNDDDIYNFITKYLNILKEYSNIFLAKNLKLNISTTNDFNYKVAHKNNLLELDIESTIDSETAYNIINSLKLKKKFYKLKTGEFISLDNDNLNKLGEVFEYLNITKDDIVDNVIKIPMYRAFYLNNLLEEKNEIFNSDESFTKLMTDIKSETKQELHIPLYLKDILRDYQVTGIKWLDSLARYNFGGILADDMGLGKTLQVISFLETRPQNTKSIVVVPTSLIYNWEEEINKFSKRLKPLIVFGTKENRTALLNDITDFDIIITTYGSLKNDIEDYVNMKFDYCFLDEAQYIKNTNTVGAKSTKLINANIKFALTGTPISNNLMDLYSIMDFLMPGYLYTKKEFSDKFISCDNTKLLKEYIRPFVLRRTKEEVLSELPSKTILKMTTALNDEEKKLYDAHLVKAKSELNNLLKEDNRNKLAILALLIRLRQICCDARLFIDNIKTPSSKLENLLELTNTLKDEGNRILIFSQFTKMLDLIGESLNKEKISYYRIDGNTKAKDRVDMSNEFNKGNKEVFLISLKAGGVGLNLTGANVVIHFDPWFNPAVLNQATDRAYRIGQKKKVFVYNLVTKDTIEEKIYTLLEKKEALLNTMLDSEEVLLDELNINEIINLINKE